MAETSTVFGPPGTGKTTYLSRQIQRATETFGWDRVLVASLTTAAAAEIGSRDIDIDPGMVGTLHAICYRALDRPKLVYSTIEDFNAEYGYKLSKQHGSDNDDLDQKQFNTQHDEIFAEIDLNRARMIPEKLWRPQALAMWHKLSAWKASTMTIDFTDMIEMALEQYTRCPFAPDAIFYDEAQDGSALELALIKKWAADTKHTIIAGDDDQTLYRWRGASVEDFLNFSERKIILSQSYRLPASVQRYAEAWIQQVQVRQPKEYKPREEEGRVKIGKSNWKHTKPLVNTLKKNIGSEDSSMVLTTCGYMLNPLLFYLRQEGIPFWNPYRVTNGAWNPLKHGGKNLSPVDRVLNFTRLNPAIWGHDSRPWTWREFASWVDVLNSKVLPRGTKKKCSEMIKDNSFVDFDTLTTLLGEDALEHATAGDLDWFESSLLGSREASLTFPIRLMKISGKDAMIRTPSLIVGTVHSVKGGQADNVYLFPDLSWAGFEELSSYQNRDNVLRTMYVGITRARQTLTLLQPHNAVSVKWLPVVGG